MIDQIGWEPELLNAISNLVCVLKDGRLVYINPAGVEMLCGGDEETLIGRELADFVHADYADLIALGIDAFAEEEAGIPLKLRPLHASPIDVQMRVRLLDELEGGEGEFYMVECRDITSHIRASKDARRREQRLAGVLATVEDSIITIDQRGVMQTANPATERIFGYAKPELIGQSINMLMPTEYADHHDEHIEEHIKTGVTNAVGLTREMIGKRKNGEDFPIEVSVAELREGTKRLYTGVIRDITERKKARAKIEHLAHHDALTGLPNRNLYIERVERAISRAQRSSKPLALLFVDLDKFKPINDDLGHEAGDLVLKAVAGRMTECVRATDTVARFGGDEFVAVLESLDHWESAAVVAKKIIIKLTAPVDVTDGVTATVGASIGISIFPEDGKTMDELARAADEAMYAVKESGRNNFKFHSELNLAS